MFKRRKPHLWLALLLALMFPIFAVTQAVAVNTSLIAGSPIPGPQQQPAPHEEDETHSQAKVALTKAVKRIRGRLLLSRRLSVLPALTRISEEQLSRMWVPVRSFRLPSTSYLDTALAHRGPPSA